MAVQVTIEKIKKVIGGKVVNGERPIYKYVPDDKVVKKPSKKKPVEKTESK